MYVYRKADPLHLSFVEHVNRISGLLSAETCSQMRECVIERIKTCPVSCAEFVSKRVLSQSHLHQQLFLTDTQ